MPIRHCQKCGLKVLVDETRAGDASFLCQRCAAGAGSAPAAPSPLVAARQGGGAPAPTGAAPKPGSVKVQCPHCKAGFSGAIPAKPAKGSCPVCRKELILLPDGSIRTPDTFDLGQWYREQESKKSAVPTSVPRRAPSPLPTASDSAFPEPGRVPAAADDDMTLMTPRAAMDDIGGETMLGMGSPMDLAPRPPAPKTPPKPAPKPADDLEAMPIPGGFGDQTMLGMGNIPTMESKKAPSPLKTPTRAPAPTPAPAEDIEAMPIPGGFGDQTMLGMGNIPSMDPPAKRGPSPLKAPPPPERTPAELESIPVPSGLGDETMLGMGNMPAVEEKGPASVLPEDLSDGTMLDMGQMVEPPAKAPQLPPVNVPTPVPRRKPAPVAPPPPPPDDDMAYDATEIQQGGQPMVASGGPEVDRTVPMAQKKVRTAPAPTDAAAAPAGPAGTGKLIAAWALLLLPLVVGFLLIAMRNNDGVNSLLKKLGDPASKGFQKLRGK